MSLLEEVVACQEALLQAIDSRDVEAIEDATKALAEAVDKAYTIQPPRSSDRSLVEHALRQSDALKMRVNTLTDWTRQRIDRIDELRGRSAQDTYTKYGFKKIFSIFR
jgi:hypothetical protein